MPAYVCAIGNQKGGVSKTTNCVHLATALAELQRRVLIIDLDANAGATRHFGIPPESFLGTFEVLVGPGAARGRPHQHGRRGGRPAGARLPDPGQPQTGESRAGAPQPEQVRRPPGCAD